MRLQDFATARNLALASHPSESRVCPIHRHPDDAACWHGDLIIGAHLPALKLPVLQLGNVSNAVLWMYHGITNFERQVNHGTNNDACCYCFGGYSVVVH